MAIQNSVNQILGSVAAGAVGFSKLKSPSKQSTESIDTPVENINTGKELRMAAKARKQAKTKINAIMTNKEISERARSRRIGKVLDEYKGGGK